MRITKTRTTVVGTPWRELVFLELETDTGLVGTSEVRMVSRTSTLEACLAELAPRHVIGTDPYDVERLAWNIQRAEYGWWTAKIAAAVLLWSWWSTRHFLRRR